MFTDEPTATALQEPPAFRTVFETYGPFVDRALRLLEVPRADRHDLTQEIFVVVHRTLHEYDGRVPLDRWIHRICARRASTYRRSRRARRKAWLSHFGLESTFDRNFGTPDRELDSRRACARAELLLAELQEDKRRIFVLYEIEGLSMPRIAAAEGCPLQTAYSRLHAARKAMKVLLERSRLAEGGLA